MSLIGTLAVNVIAQTAMAERQLKQFGGKVSGMSKSMSNMGGGGAMGGLMSAIQSLPPELALVLAAMEAVNEAIVDGAKKAGEMADQASKLGMKTADFAGLKEAASESGIKADALTSSMHRLEEQLGEVRMRNQEVIASFQKQGLNPYRLAASDTATALKMIADRAKEISDPFERAAFQAAVFGKSGRELGPMLEQGGAAIDKLIAKAKDAKRVLGQGIYDSADQANKQYERLERSAESRNIRMAGSPLGRAWAQVSTEVQTVFNQAVGDLFEGGSEGPMQRIQRMKEEAAVALKAQEQSKAAGDAAEAAAVDAKILADKQAAVAKHMDEMKKAAKEMNEEMRTPEDVYKKTITDLEEMNKLGLLNANVFSKVAKDAADKRDKVLGNSAAAKMGDLSSKAFGSQEAFAAIARQQNSMGGFKANDAEKEIEKNTGKAVDVLEEVRNGINEMKTAKPITFKVFTL